MKWMRKVAAALLATVLTASSAYAQTATIDPARKVDWTTAGAGTIPARATICSTLNPGATAADINTAITNCAADQTVKLNAGTYNLGSGIVINKNNVTLRGAGADSTFLVFSGGDTCTGLAADICIKNSAGAPSSDSPGTVANWTAGYAKDTTSITLSTVAGLSIGNMLVLDQLDDADTDTGEVWVCQKTLVCTPASETSGAAGRALRAQMQFVKVTNIVGSVVTISPGLYMPNWRSGQSPQAWWIDAGTGVGVEDLSMDHNGSGTGIYTGMFIFNQYNSWVKGVRSLYANRNHIWVYEDAHVTIRDSYFYGSQGSSSQAYGVETRMTSDLLVENNIFEHSATPMMNGNTNGTVWGYNYSLDDFYTTPTTWQQASSYYHDAGVDNTLFEGNDGIGLNGDNLHGSAHFNTSFRNYWNGSDTNVSYAYGSFTTSTPCTNAVFGDPYSGVAKHCDSGGPTWTFCASEGGTCSFSGTQSVRYGASVQKTQQSSAVILQPYHRFYNLLGNVIGTSGFHTNYECYATSSTSACASNADLSVYSLGFSGNQGSHLTTDGTLPNDTLVRDFLFRWGNYDPVNGARYQSSEVPSGAAFYPQAVPGTNNLASSLYLTYAPRWFRSIDWPPIGPDVTTGALVSAHVVKIPARQCYESSTSTNGILNFNANACYGSNRQIINNGTFSDDPSGELTAAAFVKLNTMYIELYRRILPSSSPQTLSPTESIRAKFVKVNSMQSQLATAGGVSCSTIDVGTGVGGATTDTIRSAFTKINACTATLYAVP